LWSQILLVLVSLFACVVIYRRLADIPHPEYLSYSALLLNAALFGMIIASSEALARAIELTSALTIIVVLILLLITIRIIQPQYARHPLVYSYFPLLILPFYAYFIDSEILQFVMNVSIQSTALLVYSGLVITYWKSIDKGYLLFISIIAFAGAMILYWTPLFESQFLMPVIHLLLGIGMIVSSFKFPSIITEHKR